MLTSTYNGNSEFLATMFYIFNYGINVYMEFKWLFIRSLYVHKRVYTIVYTVVYTVVYTEFIRCLYGVYTEFVRLFVCPF